MVDLDELVVSMCRKYLPNHHQGAFDDPRLTLLHEDASIHREHRRAVRCRHHRRA